MSANKDLYDRSVDHASILRVHEEELQVQMSRKMRRHEERLGRLFAKSGNSANYMSELKRANKELFAFSNGSLKEIGMAELDFQANSLQKSMGSIYKVNKPRSLPLIGQISGAKIKGNRNLEQQISSIMEGEATRINAFLKRNPNATKKELLDGIGQQSKMTRSQLDTLMTTSITQTEAEALSATLKDNPDVIKGYRFTAVLDSRTSEICAHHDGNVYDVDDKTYMPPLHWNCRSVAVPVAVDAEQLASSTSRRINKRKLKDIDPSYFDGLSPAVEDYDTWLRRQPQEVIMRHIGFDEDKYNLFVQGNLQLKQFSNAKGKILTVEQLRRLDNAATSVNPITMNKYQPGKNHNFKVPAKNVDELIASPAARQQLEELMIIDSSASLSPLSTTDFRGVLSKTKRNNRFRANTLDEDNFWFDPTTGESFNPLIYRPDVRTLDSRITKLKASKILSKEQKRFIEEFAEQLNDKVSTNQRAAVVENLRIIFERQLSPDSTSFGQPWANLTAVVRGEMSNSVKNVSKLMETQVRARSNVYSQFNGINKEAGLSILGKQRSFNDISKDVRKNQRFVNDWSDKQGLQLATKLYLKGKAPGRTYFMPPSQVNQLDFKKRILKSLDDAIEKANVPKRVYNTMKEQMDFWLRNPLDVADDAITSMAQELNVKWRSLVDLEFLYRKSNFNMRKALVEGSPETQRRALKALSGAMEELAKGQSSDYDAVAIAIGKRIRKDFATDFPWRKPKLNDYHKDGSRLLKELENMKIIRVNHAVKNRRAATDLDTGRPDAGAWKETTMREIEALDDGVIQLQRAYRELYVGRRIGITDQTQMLTLKKGTLKYEDAYGTSTTEKAITRSASSRFAGDDDVLGRHLDKDFINQVTFANKQKWTVDNEFTKFIEDVVYYTPRSDRRGPRTANSLKDLIHKRGEQGYGLMQSLKWHRQNGTSWANIHQWDGRGRFYEQGYLAATRGETVRPFLQSPVAIGVTPKGYQELMIQLGATIGEGVETLSQQGRMDIFMRNRADLLELGTIMKGRYRQSNRNIEDFLNNRLIAGHDAEEIPKIARYALEVKRIDDHARSGGYTLDTMLQSPKGVAHLQKYKSRLMVENDASSSGAQIIGLTTKDRQIANISNVVPTTSKQRLYDIIAQRTASDPRYHKIQRLGDDIGWEDLAKAAKAQNMVTFYGAGEATQVANIEAKLAERILKKSDQLIVYKDKVPGNLKGNDRVYSYREITDTLKSEIAEAELAGLTNTANQLKNIKAGIDDVIINEAPMNSKLLHMARDTHTDAEMFIEKLTNTRTGLVGPKEFERVSSIMSEYLADLAPVTEEFINFWKDAARSYVPVSGTVDIPWATFDGKVLTQRYRPKVEQAIQFKDPITGKMVTNIYRDVVDDDFLRGKGSIGDAVTGLGVNGNHMNDASIVRQYWLQSRKQDKRIATVHDGFFSHIEDADWTKETLNDLYAQAVESRAIERTVKAMRDQALENLSSGNIAARSKRIDALIGDVNSGQFTRTQINAAVDTLPGLDDALIKATGVDRRTLSLQLGKFQNTAVINDVRGNIQDGFYSVGKLNEAMKTMPALERALINEFKIPRNGLLDAYSRHGATRRLTRAKQRIDAGTMTDGSFYNTFEQNLRELDIVSVSGLRKRIAAGTFSMDDFIAAGLKQNANPLDASRVDAILARLLESNKGGIDPDKLVDGLKDYQKSLSGFALREKKAIRSWYETTMENARNRRLIDKDKTNKQILDKTDDLLNKRTKNKFTGKDLPDVYRDFGPDLEKYYGIGNLAELNKAYRNNTWKVDEFIRDQNDRYRELSAKDILRPLKEGEDRYGIGP